jgi:DnaJ-class molecular chaperone
MSDDITDLVDFAEQPDGSMVVMPRVQREWQCCPICMGSGRLWDLPLFPTSTRACHGCAGSGMVVRP